MLLLRKFRIWQKLVFICVAFALPMVWLMVKFVGTANKNRDFARKEIYGNEYNRPLRKVLEKALEQRMLASRFKNDPALRDRISGAEADVDKAIKEVEALEEKTGLTDAYGKEFESTQLFATMKNTWAELKANSPPLKPYVDEAHTKFMTTVTDLIARVGDKSNLILDPDLDSYYSMDFTLIKFPSSATQLTDIILEAEGAVDRRILTNEEKADLIGKLSVMKSYVDGSEYDYTVAFKENKYYAKVAGKLRPLVEPPLKDYLAAVRTFMETADKRVVHAARVDITTPEFQASAQKALDSLYKLYDFALPAMDDLLGARIEVFEGDRNSTLTFVFILLVVALGLIILIMRSITMPLRGAVQTAARLAEGDFTVRIDPTGADEVASLLIAMSGMLNYLKEMASVADSIAAGNLTARVTPRSQTDTFGNAFKTMIENLREIVATLQKSAQLLTESVGNLNSSASEQSQTITRQAAALQETQVTAQEIKQTSLLAAQKAEDVLKMAERADEVSRQGESAIEQSISGLAEIRGQVDEIAQRIAELNERTRQIGGITNTVKDLADQSNMLALNAAIEAVRSGEHGKGFAVVAREIRNLADQSIQATNKVREILEDIGGAIRRAVQITEKGAQKMEGGLAQVKASGENLRELSGIVKDNSAAGRQIAAAVSQQNAGITQIFTALTDQTQMMDETVKRLGETNQATTVVRDVTQRVSDVVKRYRV